MAITVHDREFWPLFAAAIREEIQRETEGVMKGIYQLERYREATGYVRGLNFVFTTFETITKETRKEE